MMAMTENRDRSKAEEQSQKIRDRAQSLREELAAAVHAPAEQDDHAAARKHSADEDED